SRRRTRSSPPPADGTQRPRRPPPRAGDCASVSWAGPFQLRPAAIATALSQTADYRVKRPEVPSGCQNKPGLDTVTVPRPGKPSKSGYFEASVQALHARVRETVVTHRLAHEEGQLFPVLQRQGREVRRDRARRVVARVAARAALAEAVAAGAAGQHVRV